jgi:alanyl-tRNA synthetase
MLIRRVLAHLQILQIASPACLPALIDLVIALARNKQSNLGCGRDRILAYLETETPAFDRTLSRGYRQLDRLLAKNNGDALDGNQLLSLVKKFGMPAPLLKTTLARRGFEFRENEYLQAMGK